MALVNIPRSREDPNYRYKMPKLISKIEGRGNGIKTNIVNMGDIARCLKRPPMCKFDLSGVNFADPTKYLGCELGTSAKFEEGEEKALVNGAHNDKMLSEILDKFIERYVLCPGCELPEIDLSVKKGFLGYKCNACGKQGALDTVHRAAAYMLKNPPKAASTLGSLKKDKHEEKKKGKRNRAEGKSDAQADNAVDSKRDSRTRADVRGEISGVAGEVLGDEATLVEPLAAVILGGEVLTSDLETTNQNETSKDRNSSKNASMSKNASLNKNAISGKGILKVKGDDCVQAVEPLTYRSPELEDVIERVREFVRNRKEMPVADFFYEVRVLQIAQGFDAKCRVYVILKALFDDHATLESLDAKLECLKTCFQGVSFKEVLCGVEHFVCHDACHLKTQYPYVLQKLYQNDILEGEEISSFYAERPADPQTKQSVSKAAAEAIELANFETCRVLAMPFLEWLMDSDDDASQEASNAGRPTECPAA